jgi:hypothetical protein
MLRRTSTIALPLSILLAGCTTEVGDPTSATKSARSAIQAPGCVPSDHVDRAAVCLCGDLDNVGTLNVLRGPGGDGVCAVNGYTNLVSDTLIEGDLVSYEGLDSVSAAQIDGDLRSAGDVSLVGTLFVGRDLFAGGIVDMVGDLSVGGLVRAKGGVEVIGDQTIGGLGDYADSGIPCPCDASTFFDVGLAVQDAKTHNDNAAAGLDPAGIDEVGDRTISLGTGRYYLGNVDTVGKTIFVIAGNVALFIDGSLDAVGDETFQIDEGGSLDIYVAGSVDTVGNLLMGDVAKPFRLLIGGEEPVLVSVGDQVFHGEIYAPNTTIDFVGNTTVVGSLFAKSLDSVGELKVIYGVPMPTDPDTCIPPGENEGEGINPP